MNEKQSSSTKLVKQQKCIVMRNGVEIWVDLDKADQIEQVLVDLKNHSFIRFEGRYINTADCSGVYLPEDMDDMKRRKNGQWKCKAGNWHDRFEDCVCLSVEEAEVKKKRDEDFYKANGFYPLPRN